MIITICHIWGTGCNQAQDIGHRPAARKKVRSMASLHFLNLQHRAGQPDGDRRRSRPRNGQHVSSSSPPSAGPPDLATTAREAVVGFLHDASFGPAEGDAGQPASAEPDATAHDAAAPQNGAMRGTRVADGISPPEAAAAPPSAAAAVSQSAAESTAWRAAAASVATLDRVESMAAKVEADLHDALIVQAELRAGAGAAAEAAVRAAQSAWVAAAEAAESERQAKIAGRLITRHLIVAAVLILIAIAGFALLAAPALR